MGEESVKQARELSLTADLEGGRYPIRLGRGTLKEVAPFLASITEDRKVLIAFDAFFRDSAASELAASLKSEGFTVLLHPIVGGKARKTLFELTQLYDLMERNTFARDSSLIALGGGVIGDMTGFAAATFLRGIHLIHVPTTVTSQIDSSIGGKVGVNFGTTINAIGSYYHPCGVFVDLAFIDELPERDFVAGLAEVIKCAMICDPAFLSYLTEHAQEILSRAEECLLHIYRRSIEIKLQHVAGDLRDRNERLKLNYGHTIGHAVELATGEGEELYRHGEGVALGMVGASFIADRIFRQNGELPEIHRNILARYGLPVTVDLKRTGFSRDEFIRRCLSYVNKDKKRVGMKVRFILPLEVGRMSIYDQVPVSTVEQAVEMLCEEAIPVKG